MNYTALYRKFRPQVFADVYGQDAIVTTLKNQILANRIGHAYLFCGTRGTGKTSIAKIFARAVNCANPIDASPCGECQLCQSIKAGASMNVIEIDAASNNGVDNIREIVDEVTYSPVEGKYKVYIIDEVHMLSTGAFNALLKTLEEPPEYVIFILATTEIHKIPMTILSRCQRYDFKRISAPTMIQRLNILMAKEGIEAEDKALRYIAKSADGAMRDAISMLDQCISFYFGQKLTYDKVLDVLGAVDIEIFSRLLRSCLKGDVSACIIILEEIVMLGRELGQFVIDFTWYLRNLLLLKASEGNTEIIDASAENMARLKEEAEMAPADVIMRYIRIFSELTNQIRFSANKRVLLEIAVVKLCKPSMETDSQSLLDRIRQIENKIAAGAVLTDSVGQSNPQAANPLTHDSAASQPGAFAQNSAALSPRPPMPKAIPADIEKIVANWPNTLARILMPMRSYLKNARLSLGEDEKLLIVVEEGLASDYLIKQPDNRIHLERILSEQMGKEITVEIRCLQENRSFEATYIDLSDIIKMEIEIDDDII
ncbi:MAG: DNA polymerase III subunit gamma/tau [Lachnospiraceae bacterium]|nr:DNA polymerase III subunit gamma/tau [Lachnospiraceae bacterium]